ncbi:prephenate dehydratase [Acuticoccus sp. I52.16.1]|uniref:prephenate dehydratase n=1 Tax=Acuticoccus sp. I52.16.1 TaxID=2928472 RepID=UPI001FD5D094|nr:prephenate dehydratase [Acuticoccus sp. I52.16.1]UOM32808.1 prephenate dehydratase [Acuticoccus sp. I52.16.1]
MTATDIVVYQGEPGANSHIAAREMFPDMDAQAQPTFEDCFAAVEGGAARYAMIPIENSSAGRVADIHSLLPTSTVHFVGEYFLPIRHQLMVLPGAPLEKVTRVYSHVQALGQCRRTLRSLGLTPVVAADTAGSARQIAATGDPTAAAIASRLAAEIYGLDIIRSDVEDEAHNTTRFVVMAAEPEPAPRDTPVMTSFLFRVRNVPAALYKALGGFATNGVNMVKLESYQTGGQFFVSMFYADVEGHPEDESVALALEELRFFSAHVRILGTYPAAAFRETIREPAENRPLRPGTGPAE